MRLFGVLSLCLCFLLTNQAMAQQTRQSEKKVTIITKYKDQDGNTVVEEKTATGDEADKLLEEMKDMEGFEGIDINIDTDGTEQQQIIIESFGDEDDQMVFEWNNFSDKIRGSVGDMDLRLHELRDMTGINNFQFFKGGNYGINRGFLGIELDNEAEGIGATVSKVLENTAAAEAGLKAGDVITQINGILISNNSELIRKMMKYEINEKIELEYSRNGKSKIATAKLKERGE